jgi:hypothetical protein
MGLFDNLFNKQKENSKFSELNNLLISLSLNKVKELTAKINSRNFNKSEADRSIIFEGLPLDAEELQELNRHDYRSIESRLAILNKYQFFDESVMIGILFLTDLNDKRRLYDASLKINDLSFLTILFLTCISLHYTRNYSLCQPYIELLQKLIIAYPNHGSCFPEDIIERIAMDCY